MKFAQLRKVLVPKVEGSMHLHEATLHLALDFFIMISSIITLIGTATQANYSAANAFQDAFARYRQSQGLPAQSIALGLLSDVGYASDRRDLQRSLNRNGVYATTQDELFKLLDVALSSQQNTADTDNPSNFDPLCKSHLLCGLEPSKIHALKSNQKIDFTWEVDARLSHVLQAIETLAQKQKATTKRESKKGEEANDKRAGTFRRLIKDTIEDREELANLINGALKARLAKMLFLDKDAIDDSKTLATYGMDSMIAAELRSWLVKTWDINMSLWDILDPSATIASLSIKIGGDWKIAKESQ